jgi:transposase-like protein
MKTYQIVKRNGKEWRGDARSIPMRVPVQELMDGLRDDVEALSMEAGLAMMRMAMEGEQSLLTDGPGRRGYRHGEQPGYVVLHGRKHTMGNLRVRDFEGREIPLKTYHRFQTKKMGKATFRDTMRGVSARDYAGGFDALVKGYGVKRSSVSRHVVEATDARLKALLERPLEGMDLVAVLIDGIHFADTLLVVAVGVGRDGAKHALGLWQGATENGAVCTALLEDLVKRGLRTDRKTLFIIDGGKALRSVLKKVFGEKAVVQRCQEHKKRNVTDLLPDHWQGKIRRRMKAAYGMTEFKEAHKALTDLVRELDGINPSAARSLEEGLEETLTMHRLGVHETLRKSLSTTNIIESTFSSV